MPELKLRIVTENTDEAKRELGQVEGALKGIETAAKKTDEPIKQVTRSVTAEKSELDKTTSATQRLAREKDILTGKMGLSKQAFIAQTAAMVGLNQQQVMVVRGASSLAQTMGVATTPALLGVSAAAIGVIAALTGIAAFMSKSVQVYVEQSGLLERHKTAIDGVKDAWNDMFFEVGEGIVGHAIGVQRVLGVVEGAIRVFTQEIQSNVIMVRTLLGVGMSGPGLLGGVGKFFNELTRPVTRGGDMDLPRGTGTIDPRLVEGPPESLKRAAAATTTIAAAAERAGSAFASWQAPLQAAQARVLQTAALLGAGMNAQFGAFATPMGNVFTGGGLFPSTPLLLQSRNINTGLMGLAPNVGSNVSSAGGGGGFFGNVFGGIGGSLSKMWSGMSDDKGMAGLFSNLGGGLLTGGLSSLMGLAMGGIRKLFGGLFGKSQSEKENDAATKQLKEFSQEWIKTNGGMDRARALADAFGVSLDGALNQKGKRGLETARGLLGDVDERQAKLKAAMDKYGIGVEQLGMKFKQLAQNDWADQILSDFHILTDAGLGPKDAIEAMAGELNTFVQKSILMGTEVPIAMQPMLQVMVQMGLLVDADGKKLEDLSKIKFSETLTQGFDRVVQKLNELLVGLGISLPAAAQHGAAGVNEALESITFPHDGAGGGGGGEPTVHGGGLILHRGGRVLRVHAGLAADEVNATLQRGEYVLQRSAVNKFGVGRMAALNRGDASGFGGPTIVNNISFGNVFAGDIASREALLDTIDEGLSRRQAQRYRGVSR